MKPARTTWHRIRRGALRIVPADRRVKPLGGARGRGRLQARKLLAPLLQRPVTLKAKDGLTLRISADPVDEQIANYILGARRGEYFPDVADREQVACVLDVGAHHGLYAAAALREYPNATIVCVEPSSAAIELLRANLAINGLTARARIVPVALSDHAGNGELKHSRDGSWGSSLFEEESNVIGTESTELMTLAEILQGDRPQIIKCNAEGAEYALVEQLVQMDLRPELIVLMVHPEFGDAEQLMARLTELGYAPTQVGTEHRPAYQMRRAVTTS